MELLARQCVVGQQHAVGGVEADGDVPAGIAECVRHLADYPDLGVIVGHDVETPASRPGRRR
jgi:hypothetical protein